jgi:hypothetical protein
VKIDQPYAAYREGYHPAARMERALSEVPSFAYFDEPVGTHFGQRADVTRRDSAQQAAPPVEPGMLPRRKGVFEVKRDKVKATLLKRLGTDWSNMEVVKVHGNRLSIHIDGDRYTLYTRSG